MNFKPFFFALALFSCLGFPVHALDDSNWNPLLTISFPMDNKGESEMEHVVVRYVLYPSGMCSNEVNVFGGNGKLNNSDTAWLSQSHVDKVLKLAAKISSSQSKPKLPIEAILICGTITGNKVISRSYIFNLSDIRLMLQLLGGVRDDLEKHFKETNPGG